MSQKAIERKSLLISTCINGLIGLAGLWVYIITGLNALLLDGVFSLIAFLSSLAAFYISKHSHRQTRSFPNGLHFLEPLYGIIKSMAILVLLVITLLETGAAAYAYFVHGFGHVMVTGPVLPYSLAMVVICLGLGFYNLGQNKRINNMSTIIQAEARGAMVDGIISGGVGIAILILTFIPLGTPLAFLHYTGDFFISLVLVALSIREPLKVLNQSFKELALSTTDDDRLVEQVHKLVMQHYQLHSDQLDILIFKQGMNITVKLYVLNCQDSQLLSQLLASRQALETDLKTVFEQLRLEYVF